MERIDVGPRPSPDAIREQEQARSHGKKEFRHAYNAFAFYGRDNKPALSKIEEVAKELTGGVHGRVYSPPVVLTPLAGRKCETKTIYANPQVRIK
jgi:hypothetical protein